MFGAILETTYNAFVRIHVRRVYEAAVTTPLSVQDVVVGEYLWATTRAMAYGTIFLIVMTVFGWCRHHSRGCASGDARRRARVCRIRDALHGLCHEHRELQTSSLRRS